MSPILDFSDQVRALKKEKKQAVVLHVPSN